MKIFKKIFHNLNDVDYFYDINCEDNIKVPLLSSQSIFKDGGKLIQILPDEAGLNFDKLVI